jgi:hypothetical protein
VLPRRTHQASQEPKYLFRRLAGPDDGDRITQGHVDLPGRVHPDGAEPREAPVAGMPVVPAVWLAYARPIGMARIEQSGAFPVERFLGFMSAVIHPADPLRALAVPTSSVAPIA